MKKLVLLSLVLIASSCAFAQGTVSHIRYGATLPSACSPSTGDVFFKTGTGVGLYACVATNTWGSPATGTVTATSMTTDCVVTASGASSIQTNTSCPTTDSSGNVVAQGSMTIGAGGSASGQILWTDQSTTPSAPSSGKTLFYTKGGKPCSETSSGVETCAGTGAGSVTSVGLTVPSWFSVSGSPVTSSGTLAVTAATGQTANRFLATPNGSTGAVSLRAIVAADIPTLNQNTTGTAANLSGTPALPNGTTATTQSSSDNSTKLATTAYVDSAVGGGGGGGSGFANSVANYSAVGNGTTDNSTPFTNACAANNVIYLPAGAYAFTSNYTITCAVEFGAGATVVAPTGVTVTFNGAITASPVTIFTTAGTGKIALGPANRVDYPEWWGAVGNGSTDDHAAINNALAAFVVTTIGTTDATHTYTGGSRVQLQAKTYSIGTSTLLMAKPAVTLMGMGPRTSFLSSSSSSADMLQINSSSCSAYNIDNRVQNLGFGRTTAATGTANGIAAWCAYGMVLSDLIINDSGRGVYLNGVGSTGYGRIENVAVQQLIETSGTYYGLYIDGGTRENPSLRVKRFTTTNTVGTAIHVHGIHVDGVHVNDLQEQEGETEGVDYGVYVDGGTTAGNYAASDIHFSHDIQDGYLVSGFYIANIATVNGGTVTISDPWVGAPGLNTAIGIDIEISSGVHVTSAQFSHHVSTGSAIKISGGSGNTVDGSVINHNASTPSAPAILLNSTSNNIIANNNIWMPSGNSQQFVKLTGATRNTIIGNNLYGYTSGSAITADADSNNNLVYTNTIDPANITTAFTDSGSGNQWNAMPNPMTTAGDIVYGAASGVPTRLAGGTSGYCLTSNGATSAPSWQVCGTGTGVSSLNSLTGGLSITAGTNITVTPSGSNIQISASGTGGGQTLSPGVPDSGTIPDISTWTAVNSATLVSQTGGSGNPALIKLTNSGSLNWRGFKTSIPSAPYSVIVRLNSSQLLQNTTTAGLYFFDNSNQMSGPELLMQSSGPGIVRIHKGTGPTNDSTDTPTVQPFWPGMGYLCIAQDTSSAHQIYYSSFDGKNWIQILSENTGTFLTPTGIGFGGIDIVSGGSDMYETLEYYRVTTNSTCQ